jgi:hypothetical protein
VVLGHEDRRALDASQAILQVGDILVLRISAGSLILV